MRNVGKCWKKEKKEKEKEKKKKIENLLLRLSLSYCKSTPLDDIYLYFVLLGSHF